MIFGCARINEIIFCLPLLFRVAAVNVMFVFTSTEDTYDKLLRVQEERDAAQKSNERLRSCLNAHRKTLASTLQQTQKALEDQFHLMEKQDAVIQVRFISQAAH